MLEGLAGISPWIVAGLVGVAFVAGWVDAIVGGGGLIQLPALLLGLPADTPVATISGTNKLSSFAGTSTATATYLRRIRVGWRDTVPLMAGAAIGSAVGARLVTLLPKQWFTPFVLVALVVVGGYLWRRPQFGLESHLRHAGAGLAVRSAAIGLAVGVYDGFLGPGTGTFFMILIVGVLGHGFLAASARAKLANVATNLAAIVTLAPHVNWVLGLMMAAANVTGGVTGARMALRHGNAFIRKVLLVVVAALVVRLSYDLVMQFR
ncbi:sulfite exporter TauE/SafE family protein [Raineyella sp. W15-4]|uniref:sulfite exporter TauE/SafE family protein n=1 Tax=Raineyella sp. W15-4 TaxID=3081651 RepID=UPI002953A34D|nr:TSUP family transporter [Raineyella sp. W15-4]WOQ18326.1 TSUP family transporter [Raineyella sp. W15-4]